MIILLNKWFPETVRLILWVLVVLARFIHVLLISLCNFLLTRDHFCPRPFRTYFWEVGQVWLRFASLDRPVRLISNACQDNARAAGCNSAFLWTQCMEWYAKCVLSHSTITDQCSSHHRSSDKRLSVVSVRKRQDAMHVVCVLLYLFIIGGLCMVTGMLRGLVWEMDYSIM